MVKLSKKDLDQNVKDIKGEDLIAVTDFDENNRPIRGPISIRDIVSNAVLASYEDEKALAGKKKMERYMLAQKLNGKDSEIELEAEEVAMVKDLVGKGSSPVAVGAVWSLFDPVCVKTDEKETKKTKKT